MYNGSITFLVDKSPSPIMPFISISIISRPFVPTNHSNPFSFYLQLYHESKLMSNSRARSGPGRDKLSHLCKSQMARVWEFAAAGAAAGFTPAASSGPAAGAAVLRVQLIKNMTVFLTFCSLHIFGISTWMVYSSRHQVCQATLPNFLAVFCDKFLAQLPVVPRRARCVNCINPSSKLEMADFWEIASLRIWYVRTGAAGARPSGD